MIRISFLLMAVLTLLATHLQGQEGDTLGVQAALSHLRAADNGGAAMHVLLQKRGKRPARELDALADSLVAIAVSVSPDDPPEKHRIADSAIHALVFAGRGDTGGTPYPRAFEALVRVFQGGKEVGMRAGTLWALTQLPDVDRGIDFLGEVAASADPLAQTAIMYLSMDVGEAGLTRLERLYRTDAVVEPTARQRLEALAEVHGWNKRGLELEQREAFLRDGFAR